MALATLTEDGQFSKVFDRAYYEAIEYKHRFIDLRKNLLPETELFSEKILGDAQQVEKQLSSLTKSARALEKNSSFYNLANHVIEFETRLCKLYCEICNEAWEKEQQFISSILAKKEERLADMLPFKKLLSPDKNL